MKLVRVEIPFREIATNKVHKAGKKIELPDETVERLQKINSNIVTVLEDIPEDTTETPELVSDEQTEG